MGSWLLGMSFMARNYYFRAILLELYMPKWFIKTFWLTLVPLAVREPPQGP